MSLTAPVATQMTHPFLSTLSHVGLQHFATPPFAADEMLYPRRVATGRKKLRDLVDIYPICCWQRRTPPGSGFGGWLPASEHQSGKHTLLSDESDGGFGW